MVSTTLLTPQSQNTSETMRNLKISDCICQTTIETWDFGLDYYENHIPAAQQAVVRRNGFLDKVLAPLERNNGVAEMFYNTFEIIDVARFLQPDNSAFNEALDATDNIYRYR